MILLIGNNRKLYDPDARAISQTARIYVCFDSVLKKLMRDYERPFID